MAIYRPVFMQPNSVAVDATVDNDFTCIIQGTVAVSYDLTIRRVSDNAIIYNTGEITLPSPLYNEETLTITVPLASGMANGTDYKWQIKIYEVVSGNFATSEEVRFFARTTPVVTIDNFVDPVTTRDYVFEGIYTQAESVSLKYHQWILYDSTGDNILEDTGRIFNAKIEFDYDRYLDGQTYQIELIVENQLSTIVSTGKILFDTVYTFPAISFTISAINNPDDDSILIDWSGAVQIPGVASGVVSYLSDTPFVGTDSVKIESGTVSYTEQNNEQLNLNNNNTTFIHNNFDSNMYVSSDNRLSGSGWEINGVLFTQTADDGTNEYLKILAFELDSFLLYTQFSPTTAPILVEQYRIYGAQNLFVLQPSPTPIDAFYAWDDNAILDDNNFWIDGEDISTVWWKLAWISPTASTHELIWERSADS
jgi:hypothetical protein